MASIMRLRPGHKKHHVITSPLLTNAKELTEDAIKATVQKYYDNPTTHNRDEAIMAFGSIIRYITSRYLGAFRSMVSLEDDLITRGFLVVMSALDDRTDVDEICRLVSGRIMSAQTEEIHDARASGFISLRTQRRRVSNGEPALYTKPIDDTHDSVELDPSIREFEFYRSLVDRKDLSPMERNLLRPENWGKTRSLLATKYDVDLKVIRQAYRRLIDIAKEQLYAD